MKAFALSLIMILAMMTLWAGITHTYTLAEPEFTPSDRGTLVTLSGAQSYGHPSAPDLPWFGYKLLLPLGSEAYDIVVKRYGKLTYELDDIIMPVQSQYPISHGAISTWDEPDAAIYGSNAPFPKQSEMGLHTEFLNGHPIAFGVFSPFEYYPEAKELVFYSHIEVELNFHSTTKATAAQNLLKQDEFIVQRLKTSVDNQADIPSYSFHREGEVEYLVILDANKTAQWQPLVNFYRNRGLSVMLQPVDQIYSDYAGRDNQEKIRNCIIAVYTANPLRYVLLAGDTDLILHRGMSLDTGSHGIDNNIPADMYYACLDGDWDANNNGLWGEAGETDLAPELAVGRISYNNDAEIANQINKIIMYQSSPVVSNIKSAIMVGENLDSVPTYGGNYMEEMIGGTSNHSYTTVGVPLDWNIDRLYDRNSNWNSSQVLALLSTGANLVNHLGHSNTSYNMKTSSYQLTSTSVSNDGITGNYSIHFTQGCYAGAFEGLGEDCISEKFTSLPSSAVGMISHSRYGWYSYGSTNGISQRFHRQYLDAIFGEGIHELGYALVDSKIDNISFCTDGSLMQYVSFNTNLLGCPATSVWSDTPALITADLPSTWLVDINQYSIQTNAPHAQIKIKRGASTFYEGFANATGLVTINLQQGFFPGNYVLYLNAANFYASSYNIFVTASDMPYVICEDISTSAVDGILQTGDTVNISLAIKNLGMVDLSSGGTISLTADSENIQILQGNYSFAAFALTDSLLATDAFQIGIVGSFADRTEVLLSFAASFGSYETESLYSLDLSAPVLNLPSYTFHGLNPYVMPGDATNIDVTLQNTGRGTAFNPHLQISCSDALVTLHNTEYAVPSLEAGASIDLANVFALSISSDVELGTDITINYVLEADSGTVLAGAFILHVGMLSFDFEIDHQDWNFAILNPNFINQWQRRDEKNTTEGGSYSMKFGGSSPTNYAVNAYGALTSPELELAPNSRFKFQHWMDAQKHATIPNKAWDGGNVQMSINGGAWFLIEPIGSYPYSIHNTAVSPFSMGTPVYSGSFDWTEAVFDLAAYSGTVRIRFVFGSDASICGQGWYIDDIRLECDLPSSTDLFTSPALFSLGQNYPNPFNPHTQISFSLPQAQIAKLSIYNLKGQLVKKLWDSSLPAGQTTLSWDGRDERGQLVSTGIYHYRLQSADKSITRRMILMK